MNQYIPIILVGIVSGVSSALIYDLTQSDQATIDSDSGRYQTLNNRMSQLERKLTKLSATTASMNTKLKSATVGNRMSGNSMEMNSMGSPVMQSPMAESSSSQDSFDQFLKQLELKAADGERDSTTSKEQIDGPPKPEQIATYNDIEQTLFASANTPEKDLTHLIQKASSLTSSQRQELADQAIKMIKSGELRMEQFRN